MTGGASTNRGISPEHAEKLHSLLHDIATRFRGLELTQGQGRVLLEQIEELRKNIMIGTRLEDPQ